MRRVLLALAGTAALGCSANAPIYFQGETITAAGGEEVFPTTGVKLRFRTPTEREQMQLQMQAESLGYGMDVPWVSRDKVHIELSYKVTNISGDAGDFTLIVDGASEYTQYDVQVVSDSLGGDDPIILPLITTIKRTLEPGASMSGIIREDDFAEGEIDLDALGRWNDTDAATPTFAGVLINRSEAAPYTGMGLVPGYKKDAYSTITLVNPNLLVVPALFQIDVRLQTDVAMTCEYYVRVRDDDDRLWHNDLDDVFQPSPAAFQPAPLM